jgi:LPXTG-site transpeptidase (sortase) family protein
MPELISRCEERMSRMEEAGTRAPSRLVRAVLSELGNVFLGMALGLVSYYAITSLQTSVEQATLRAETPAVFFEERVVEAEDGFDFEGWEAEDAAYWSELSRGRTFGRIVAPDMGLDALVVKGVRRGDLIKGPGWIDYTDLPGPNGNCGISGHRTTYGAPFRRLDRLEVGDTVEFYSPYRRYTYRVRETFAVTPDRVDVVATTETPTLTLTACHPPYSARLRLIVQADLVEVRRLEE